MKTFDRRRILLAVLFTVTAVTYAVWRSNKSAGNDEPASAAPPTTIYRPQRPPFLVADTLRPPPAQIDILVGARPQTDLVPTMANYRKIGQGRCIAPLAPLGKKLTVRNVDTAQEMTCRNDGGDSPIDPVGVTINTEDFAKIGDLSDSPIHVTVSWT